MTACARRFGHRRVVRGRGPGRIAHDLNNLLMAIVGNCDLLERGAMETGDAVRAIRAAAESAGHLAEALEALESSSRVPRA